MITNVCIRVQGRCLSRSELAELQVLIDEHPHWSRHGVAKDLCARWDWRTPAGRLKTVAARRDRERTRLKSSHLGISFSRFFFNSTPTPELSPLPLPAALPICRHGVAKDLCARWDWRTPAGRLKTFAAR